MDLFGNDELFEEFEGKERTEASDASDENEVLLSVHSSEYQDLLKKYQNLRQSVRYLSRPANIKIKEPTREGPIAHVILFNNSISRKYHDKIKDFFVDLCTAESRKNSETDFQDIQPTFIQYANPEKESRKEKSSRRQEAKKKAFQGYASFQLYDKFYIDQIGEPLNPVDSKLSISESPQYEPSDYIPLIGENESGASVRKKIERICFNCGKNDHQIKDCDKKRDFKAINERRKKFMDTVARLSGGPQIRIDSGRYHRDEDDCNSERFSSFNAGVISPALQEALGMKEEDLPPYIYRMRVWGYPPGHMKDAEIVESGLSMYEEGELGQVKTNEYVPIDTDKLISFPGFNIPPLPGTTDKHDRFGVPPMIDDHSKENMMSYFQKRNELHNRQKKANSDHDGVQNTRNRDDVNTSEVDMETDNDDDAVDPIPLHTISQDNDAKSQNDSVEMEILEGDVASLTEDELEVKRELLLKQLKQQEGGASRDSDYREFVTQDQDYRTTEEVITVEDSPVKVPKTTHSEIVAVDSSPTVCSIKDSPDSPDVEIINEDDPPIIPTDTGNQIDLTEDIAPHESKLQSGIAIPSDTDYRTLHPVQHAPTVVEPSLCEPGVSTAENQADDGQKRLPDREKFAAGINKFDVFLEESKPKGVYLKLKGLLKDSPRRKDK